MLWEEEFDKEFDEKYKCPNSSCDGYGTICELKSERQYVTRDMASDAGDPFLEGSIYSDEEWDYSQCQWCHEVRLPFKELLKQSLTTQRQEIVGRMEKFLEDEKYFESTTLYRKLTALIKELKGEIDK